MDTLNVPLSLMKRLSKEKRLLELACAILVKRGHTNSTLYNFSIKTIQSYFHIAHDTAVRYRKMLLGSDLFIYNPKKNTLYAKTFKSQNYRVYGNKRHNFTSNSDYCLKFDVDLTDERPRDVVVMLREYLLTRAIDAPRKESLKKHLLSQREENFVPDPIKLSYLAGAISMSRASACRYKQRLVAKGVVSESENVIEVVSYHYDSEWLENYRKRHPHSYVYVIHSDEFNEEWCVLCKGKRYLLIDAKLRESFKNVIYNHPMRVKSVAQKTVDEQVTCGGTPDFFYDNIIKHRIL